MKHIIITTILLFSLLPTASGQNTLRIDEYEICSNQLDTIMNDVLKDVEDGEIVLVTSVKKMTDDYQWYVDSYKYNPLRYDSNVIGYTIIRNTIILFTPCKEDTSIKEQICKKTNNHRKTFSCKPPPPKDRTYLDCKGNDGCKEWAYCIKKGKVFQFRKILLW